MHGTHEGETSSTTLVNYTANWAVDYWVGALIKNTSDSSTCIATSNNATSITCANGLSGGTDNQWENGDGYILAYFNPGYQNNNAFRYFDDIYIDDTFARVMLANSQNYSNATIIEPQIPFAWSDNSISVTVNLGKFNDSGIANLFVFDADNNYNEVGYPINISSGTTNPICGDNICSSGENCSNCKLDCGSCPQQPIHEADTDSSGSIETNELFNYISLWRKGLGVSISQVIEAIKIWKVNKK